MEWDRKFHFNLISRLNRYILKTNEAELSGPKPSKAAAAQLTKEMHNR